ncbi:MAG TPA: hypothetical protein VMM18_13555 [Gemmatimonadaceae bacterium]|nr:hypothetical protein [Gemmatimonadaceae bacterium]
MTSATCVPNIEQRGIRRRLISGWVSFGTAVVLAAVLVAAGSPSWARLLLFLPLWSAGIGLFQAREKT